MTELDMVLHDDSQAIAEWIKEHQLGDIFDQYERYVCHTARLAMKGLGEGEPLDFDSWLNQ
tara:strand:- start:573 stop:755 length:183 start_codon:yes stop_codon:yes gene_type:complete